MISIIVPIYNTASYLSRCIESLQQQTVQDIEILLVDNGSTDDSLSICQAYAEQDPRIRVLEESRKGAAYAREMGIHVARGAFLTFVDSDDWIDADMYEQMLSEMEAEETVDIVVGGFVRNIDGADHDDGPRHLMRRDDAQTAIGILLDGEIYGCILCDKLYRRSLFDHLPPLSDYTQFAEDLELNMILFLRARYVTFLPIYGYHYYMRPESISHRGFSVDFVHRVRRLRFLRTLFPVDAQELRQRMDVLTFEAASSFLQGMLSQNAFEVPEYEEVQGILKESGKELGMEVPSQLLASVKQCREDRADRRHQMEKAVRQALQETGKKKVYLYGAGIIGRETAMALQESGIALNGFVVSKVRDAMESVAGLSVVNFEALSREERELALFGIALSRRHLEEIQGMLAAADVSYVDLGQYSYAYAPQKEGR